MRKFQYLYQKKNINGQIHYYVKTDIHSEWIEVSSEVYETLVTSNWKEEKQTQRYYQRIIPIKYEYDTGTSISPTENKYLELQCESCENTFLENELRQEFWRILRENCTDSELQMIHALFFENVTEQAYADRLGIPRSTLSSRKISLFKRLKKIFKNF